jgi:uncharacterized circularly permuted ATP-grasp superfamily protein/uncharacterized alpha-E superfamily protein
VTASSPTSAGPGPAAAGLPSGPNEGYRAHLAQAGGGVDELYAAGPDGLAVRNEQEFLARAVESLGLPGLLAARAEARRLAADDGIRYGVPLSTTPGQLGSRPWVIDPLPVVLGSEEWAGVERGIQQRAVLLQLLLDDLYGDRTLVRRGVLPAEVVLGHPGFVRQVDGIGGRANRLVLGASDLGRDADGRWRVISDKTSAPSGAGYSMANRRITSRVLAALHRETDLTRLRGFFHTMSAAVRDVAPAAADTPRVVLLSPGSMSETAYDQSFLASLVGFPLVEADDLSVRDGRVWIRSAGRLEPVDVVLRRVDPDYCDPLELRADSQLGLPGLVEATRRGTVSVANPIGAQVLENPGLAPFLPAVARALLGEDLLLPAADSWWCGDPEGLDHVLAHLDQLVVRPLSSDVQPPTHGSSLSAAHRDDLVRRIREAPWAWVGQDPLPMSTTPIVAPAGLRPGRLVLRSFWVSHEDDVHVMPGGLGRVNPDSTSSVISSASGAIAKDVWVLAADSQRQGWGAWPGEAQPMLLPVRQPTAVAPRVADNLFWIGRYAARAESTARLLRVADDLVEDHALRPGTPGAATMDVMLAAAAELTRVAPEPDRPPLDHLRRMVADSHLSGTVAHSADRLVDAAQRVRDQLSYDIWHVLSQLERTLDHIPPDEEQLQPQLYDVLQSLLAVAGVIGESMVRDESWGLLDGGQRVERAQLTAALLGSTLARERSPIIDGQVTEAVLEVGESIITHRRRTVAGEGPPWPVHSAVSLLLLDRGNPRSVAFQVDRLVEDLHLIGDELLVERAAEMAADLARVDLVEVCAGDRSALAALLDTVVGTLRGISDDLARRRFRRKPSQRALPTVWSVVPR